jgi:aminomuconate-semialdehyde/2-hydroxymuconate-6-semialdehyde dehydrogenase
MPRALLSNFVGGRFVPAASGETLPDHNPATGAVIATLPASGAADVDAAVAAARTSLAGPWGRTTVTERADLLDRVADGIKARFEELVQLESLDTGKPVHTARTIDIARAVSNFRFFAGAVRHLGADAHHMGDALNYTVRRPLGVVGLITPWNLPLYLLSWKVAPALAMGNAVIAKPSELTPRTAHVLAQILRDAGLPDGAFNLLHGRGAQVGAALCTHPGVAAISFTGGTATGARVAAAAAPAFKKLSLELGGKNATVVFGDCDLERTLDQVTRASFANQGQVCLCGERLLVHASIADRFVAGLAARAKAMPIGDPSDERTRFGAQISPEHLSKIEDYVQLARDEGGVVVTGGRRPVLPSPFDQGAFTQPTIIDGLRSTARVATEEIFGPVVTVHRFEDDADAVGMANEVEYGLSAAVFTQDLRRAHTVAASLDVGTVWVNTWLKRDLRVPFGGVKKSGVGREGGRYSLEFYSEPKNICIDLG